MKEAFLLQILILFFEIRICASFVGCHSYRFAPQFRKDWVFKGVSKMGLGLSEFVLWSS